MSYKYEYLEQEKNEIEYQQGQANEHRRTSGSGWYKRWWVWLLIGAAIRAVTIIAKILSDGV